MPGRRDVGTLSPKGMSLQNTSFQGSRNPAEEVGNSKSNSGWMTPRKQDFQNSLNGCAHELSETVAAFTAPVWVYINGELELKEEVGSCQHT